MRFGLLTPIGLLPSRFVLALFPVLSRRAAPGDATFLGVYRLAVKLLLGIAVPIALGITVLAYDTTRLLWGARFLPESAIALQILVWYVPGSFWNGLTQVVLIAVGQQRWITVGFFLATAFNVVANLLLVPRYGLVAAAWTTVASEVVLFVPFAVIVRRSLGTLPFWREALPPLIGGLAAAAVALGLGQLGSPAPRRSRRGAVGLRHRVAGAATTRPRGVATGRGSLAACGAALKRHTSPPAVF